MLIQVDRSKRPATSSSEISLIEDTIQSKPSSTSSASKSSTLTASLCSEATTNQGTTFADSDRLRLFTDFMMRSTGSTETQIPGNTALRCLTICQSAQ
jgi:hypothetical protein